MFRRDRSREREQSSSSSSGGGRISKSRYNNDNRGNRGGGGGSGGGAGRGGGRYTGGGGGGGRGSSMSEVEVLNRLVGDSSENRALILRVIDPAIEDRYRDELMEGHDNVLPAFSTWRKEGRAGVHLGEQFDVRANFFSIDSSAIPFFIFQYDVKIFGYKLVNGTLAIQEEDLALKEDVGWNSALVDALGQSQGWRRPGMGVVYDGRSLLYSTEQLAFPVSSSEQRGSFDMKHPTHGRLCSVSVSYSITLEAPRNSVVHSSNVIQALDTSLLSFARWRCADPAASWILSGIKAFRSDADKFSLSPTLAGMMGYKASLKASNAGLAVCIDISVSVFLKGGPLLHMVAAALRFADVQDMVRTSTKAFSEQERRLPSSSSHSSSSASAATTVNYGLPSDAVAKLLESFKGAKVLLTHLGHFKKIHGFGPAASSASSMFACDGRNVTIREYYLMKVRSPPSSSSSSGAGVNKYTAALGLEGLKYPTLPTINVGSSKKPLYIPLELVTVLPGQSRSRSVTGNITSQIIKVAAMKPDERMRFLADSRVGSLMHAIAVDEDAKMFGIGGGKLSTEPMRVDAQVLFPPKLQYGDSKVISPMLGTWNLANGVSFYEPAPLLGRRSMSVSPSNYLYAIVFVYTGNRPPNNFQRPVEDFKRKLESESVTLGIPLECISSQVDLVPANLTDLSNFFSWAKGLSARCTIVVLGIDVYADVKLAADKVGMPTQCCKWDKIPNPPRGYNTNLLSKVNIKMGGLNQVLASRAPAGSHSSSEEKTFQIPPTSSSWIMDEPCMVVGIDATHPEKGSLAPTVVAMVGSMDGSLGRYCAHMSACPANTEITGSLTRGMIALLESFASKNSGEMPKRLLVYRDGVADNQFHEVVEKEVRAIRVAFSKLGYPEEQYGISVIVCQKRHNTRLFYREGSQYTNVCVGLCAGDGSIVSGEKCEFYLNSHLAVLGTSKPCKYTLIYDTIGLKVAELQLFTYWLTHLYCRCTRSVSYATPAYYAHWAAKRGACLLKAGCSPEELQEICEMWMREAEGGMFFI